MPEKPCAGGAVPYGRIRRAAVDARSSLVLFDRCASFASLHPPPAALGDAARHSPSASGSPRRYQKKRRPNGRHSFWQGQKDLNPRHSVLETDALPTELYPYLYSVFLRFRIGAGKSGSGFDVVDRQGLEPRTDRL